MALRDRLERAAEALWYSPRGPAFFTAAPLLGPASLVTALVSRQRRARTRNAPALPDTRRR